MSIGGEVPGQPEDVSRDRLSTVLIVTLHDRSWGRAHIAQSIAKDLQRAGSEVLVVTHAATKKLFEAAFVDATQPRVFSLDSRLGAFLVTFLRGLVRRFGVDLVLYCDYLGAVTFAHEAGPAAMEELLDWNCPTITLDCWNHRRTGFYADVVGAGTRGLCPIQGEKAYHYFESIGHYLVPAPLASITDSATTFRFVPDCSPDPHTKADFTLDLPEGKPIALLTTGSWQNDICDDPIQRASTQIAQLVSSYVRQIADDLVLLHIGPSELPLRRQLGHRYIWRSPVSPADFDRYLTRVDLLLSLNLSATTIPRAISVGCPVVVVHNSIAVPGGEPATTPFDLTPAVQSWIRGATPLQPFRMWPLGYYRFLAPLLVNNELLDAVETVELLDEIGFIKVCRALLTSPDVKSRHRERQRIYIDRLRSLPGPAAAVQSLIYARRLSEGQTDDSIPRIVTA